MTDSSTSSSTGSINHAGGAVTGITNDCFYQYQWSVRGSVLAINDENLLALGNFTKGYTVTLDNAYSTVSPVTCYHQHIYSFMYNNVVVESPSDSTDDLEVESWPLNGAAGSFCSLTYTTISGDPN